MKRKILVGVIAGTLLVSAGTIGSIAVSANRNGNHRNDCGSFIDENSNSICDNYENGSCPAYVTGKGNCGGNFTDGDNDGVCDNDENGNCPANGAGKGNGNCGGNFTDEDNDGVCDNYAERERPMDGSGRKCGMNGGSGKHCVKGKCGNR